MRLCEGLLLHMEAMVTPNNAPLPVGHGRPQGAADKPLARLRNIADEAMYLTTSPSGEARPQPTTASPRKVALHAL